MLWLVIHNLIVWAIPLAIVYFLLGNPVTVHLYKKIEAEYGEQWVDTWLAPIVGLVALILIGFGVYYSYEYVWPVINAFIIVIGQELGVLI